MEDMKEIDADEKETCAKAKILKLLDTVARAKENDQIK